MIVICKYNFQDLETTVETNKHVEGGKFLDIHKALSKVTYL